MPFQIGQRVADYEILGVLGAGGMGAVYRVRHVISQRVEALKILLPDLAAEPDLAARFKNEIRTLAAFDHPNIAQLYTALQSDNQLLMVMEFVEGSTLAECVRQTRLSVETTLGYVDQVLAALAYAHGQGVIHRDIKPSNMMITPAGSVKLMDFGIAKSVGDGDLTRPGMTMGSLSYMSPEQARGAVVDSRSDVYSVGVMLYELTTGEKPFQADSTYALLELQLKADARPPVELNPSLPKALNEIILTALAKDPDRRFQSAQAFKNALKSATPALTASAIPTQSRTIPATPQPRPVVMPAAAASSVASIPPARSHRFLWITAGALGLLAVFVLAALLVPRWVKARAAGADTNASPASISTGNEAAASEPKSQAIPQASVEPAPVAPPAITNVESTTEAAKAAPGPPATHQKPVPVVSHSRQQQTTVEPARRQPAQDNAGVEQQPPPSMQEAPAHTAAANAEQAAILKERMLQLGTRAQSVKESIDRLRAQQEASGYGLRQDISASFNRMEAYLDEASRSSHSGDLADAGRRADQAEREIDNLEKFTGK